MALLQGRSYRNDTAIWFSRYSSRALFRRLGYQSGMEELMDDEAEWFKAVDIAMSDAEKALKAMKKGVRGRGK